MKIANIFCMGVLLVLLITISSCAGIKFNQESQNRNERVKTLTESVVGLATDDYNSHANQVQALKDSFAVAIAAENARGKTNYPTQNMWKALNEWVNKDFAEAWKNSGKLGAVAVGELKIRANKLFDYITNLENNKIKKK